MQSAKSIFVFLALVFCSVNGYSLLRFINGVSDAVPVDVIFSDKKIFTNIAFKQITPFIPIFANKTFLYVNNAGSPDYIEFFGTVWEDNYVYTVGIVGSIILSDRTILSPVQEQFPVQPPAPGYAGVRFAHWSTDTPNVDVVIANGGPIIASNVTFTQITDYLQVPAGSYDLTLNVARTPIVIVALNGIQVNEGLYYTAFVVGLNSRGTLTALLSVEIY